MIGKDTRMLNDIEVDSYLASCVEIEPLAIEEEFVKISSDLAYWGERYARAVNDFLKAKENCRRVEGRLHLECKSCLQAASEKKAPTVGDIESAVITHPDMMEAKDAEIAAEDVKTHLDRTLDAIRCKKDMLIQIGARQRVELEHDPVIRERMHVARIGKEGY